MKCERCGTSFAPVKSWQRFCSSACRVRGHRAKNRTIASAGLSEIETSLVLALGFLRVGDPGRALFRARKAVAALEDLPRRRRGRATS